MNGNTAENTVEDRIETTVEHTVEGTTAFAAAAQALSSPPHEWVWAEAAAPRDQRGCSACYQCPANNSFPCVRSG